MRYINQPYKEPYVLNGNRYYKVTTPTIIQNKSTGRIVGVFRIENVNERNYIASWSDSSNSFGRIFYDTDKSFKFEYYLAGTSFLKMRVPFSSIGDTYKQYNNFEIIVDGLDNKIVFNSVEYRNFEFGTGITTGFTANNLITFTVGNEYVYSASTLFARYKSKGLIPNITIYDTDLTTPLYSFESDGDTYSASSPTILVKNTLLDLPLNNSFVDISDTPKTITQSGAITWEEGAFGEVNGSAKFDNNDRLSFVNTENPTQYSVMGWIKHNSTDSSKISYLLANNTATGQNYGDLGIQLQYINSNVRLTVFWKYIATFYSYSFDLGLQPNKYFHITASFDSVNKIVDVWVNGKYVNKSLNISTSSDLTKVQALPSATYFLGGQGNNLGVLTDCSVYEVGLYKYLLTPEEIVENFRTTKKY